MSTAIHLAGPDDSTAVLALMARNQSDRGLPYDDAHRRQTTLPLLEGSPLGALWLIGPQRAPLGYVMISFGWSMAFGGMIGWLADIYIRPSVRNRGIGTEVLHTVARALRQADLRALHVQIPDNDADLIRFCAKAGFAPQDNPVLMTDVL